MENVQETIHKQHLWQNKNYLLLQSGQMLSSLGNNQQFLALPLLVLALTHSTVQAGLAVGLSTIAQLVVSPLAGALVDRWDRKATMLICDAARLLLILSLPLAFWLGGLTMLHIYLVVALTSVFGTFFNIANTAALPNVVSEQQLPAALAQTEGMYAVVRTIGSLIGGTLYSLGTMLPFLGNAFSFAASVLTLGLMRGRFQRTQTCAEPLRKSLAAGFAWLWRQPLLRFLTLINGADSLRYGAGYLVIIVLAQRLHISQSGIGAIFTGAALGALLGNLASQCAQRRVRFPWLVLGMFWLEALMFPLYAVAPNALSMGLIAAAEEFIGPMYLIALTTYRLQTTPDALRGRVSSLVSWIEQGAGSLGALLSGFLIQSIGAQRSALVLGAWLILVALIATINRNVRQASL